MVTVWTGPASTIGDDGYFKRIAFKGALAPGVNPVDLFEHR